MKQNMLDMAKKCGFGAALSEEPTPRIDAKEIWL
jgi:hypothetical protein